MSRNKSAETLPKITPAPGQGSVHSEMKRCGRDNCRCTRGRLHGPYFYRYYRVEGQLCKRYVKRSELEIVQAECAARRSAEAELREERQRMKEAERAGLEQYRQMLAVLKDSWPAGAGAGRKVEAI